MNLHLHDKIIIVTNGADGIGKSICKLLAAEESIPFIIGSNEEDNKELVEQIKSSGYKAESCAADLTNPDECKVAIDEVIKRFKRIDGLVNHADLSALINKNKQSDNNLLTSLQNNVVHYFLITQYALPLLIQSKGSIVNVTYSNAETSEENAITNAACCGAHKALTREWAVNLLKYNLRVNAVVISNESLLQQDSATNKEAANTVAFLLSEKSSHTTGQIIHINMKQD